MEIFCTYCSKEKDELIDSLPAIHRYKSKRIRKVNESAKLLGYPMFILSGKYGLISTEQKIPFYDHRLLDNEVENLVNEYVKDQIKKFEITKVFFFQNSSDPFIKPYSNAINLACQLTNTPIYFFEIDIGEIEDVQVSGYREIWYASLEANQMMVRKNDSSASEFMELIKRYPNDGMLYYERGEAFESLRKYDSAKKDYELALMYFPNPKWKNVAYEGLKRIQNKISPTDKMHRLNLDKRWNYFHFVHDFAYIPHNMRIFVLSALERYDQEEKLLSTGEFRICLEMVTMLLTSTFETVDRNNYENIRFCKRTKDLFDKGYIDYELKELMINCWSRMSYIIHPFRSEIVPDKEYETTLEQFFRILALLNQERILPLD